MSGAVAELADAEDLKSSGGDTLWVQVPPALLLNHMLGRLTAPTYLFSGPIYDQLILHSGIRHGYHGTS